jgi:hypothetical protein
VATFSGWGTNEWGIGLWGQGRVSETVNLTGIGLTVNDGTAGVTADANVNLTGIGLTTNEGNVNVEITTDAFNRSIIICKFK